MPSRFPAQYSTLLRLAGLGGSLLLMTAVAGCTTQAKAKAEARAAFIAGQQEVLLRLQQPKVPSVAFVGPVSNPVIPWTEDLTLAKALVTANYYSRTDPIEIVIMRNGQSIRVDPRQLLRGDDLPLESGDVVQIR